VLYIRFFFHFTNFLQELKEEFEIFCNKGVVGNTSAKLIATFCDNILKKGSSENLSDEYIENTLEKVAPAFVHVLYDAGALSSTKAGKDSLSGHCNILKSHRCR
jgi:hypothetical protein